MADPPRSLGDRDGDLAFAQEKKFKEMMESMLQMFVAVNTKLDNVTDRRTSMGTASALLPKVVKFDFPKFNGEEDPTSWEELCERYGPTRYQDFFGNLIKLRQKGTVRDNQTEFSWLLLRAGKLSPEYQV
ncbi:hypothetical protein AMTRI_Chr08g166920 [Amborella trichopoda]